MIKMKPTDVFKDNKGRDITNYEGEVVTAQLVLDKYAFNMPVEIAAKIMHKTSMFVRCGLRRNPSRFPFGCAEMESENGQYSYWIVGAKLLEFIGIKVEA